MPSSSRARALAEVQKAQRARERRTRFLVVGGVLAVVVALVAVVAVVIRRDAASRPSLDAVTTVDRLSRNHVTTPVDYAQSPPLGGDHNPIWLNCGVYDQPVKNELAVHSLEHGAVWVTYRPDLPADQVERLVAALPDTYVVVSPFEGLSAPVVASAWGVQLELTGVDDPRLAEFVREYRTGPQTPEPGAACTGGSDGTEGTYPSAAAGTQPTS
ncbi:DUF3105 domain-containing protein [Phycicoccus sonneratiae]|uniref:DUF3105 domain-containing protein n=1 Tax=Phycicoccus sonneratiae TaxID=2807628 RepID=A0ABS2CIU0_9MICO|nr:DUF3105 domain-containing protein [Phycicoccus sonneraticus]MBM6399798.1 DUF3105 domain-containing protein [Phycicoccus sonneraticus]